MGGVDFHPSCGGVSAEFAIVDDRAPEVIEVLSVVWRLTGVVSHGVWVEFCVGVGAPHVSEYGGLGEFGGDLLGLCGVHADELAFPDEEVGCVGEWAGSIESLSRTRHGGWSNSNPLLVSVWEF